MDPFEIQGSPLWPTSSTRSDRLDRERHTAHIRASSQSGPWPKSIHARSYPTPQKAPALRWAVGATGGRKHPATASFDRFHSSRRAGVVSRRVRAGATHAPTQPKSAYEETLNRTPEVRSAGISAGAYHACARSAGGAWDNEKPSGQPCPKKHRNMPAARRDRREEGKEGSGRSPETVTRERSAA